MTDVTKNSRHFAVASTTCSTLLLAVFFPPADIRQALVQHTQCPCRFVMLATKALYVVTSFETGICLYRKYNIRPGTFAVYTNACGVWVAHLEYGCGALGIFKSPAFTHNQAWIFIFPIHTISPSWASVRVAGGVCRPRSEAPCMTYKIRECECCKQITKLPSTILDKRTTCLLSFYRKLSEYLRGYYWQSWSVSDFRNVPQSKTHSFAPGRRIIAGNVFQTSVETSVSGGLSPKLPKTEQKKQIHRNTCFCCSLEINMSSSEQKQWNGSHYVPGRSSTIWIHEFVPGIQL